MEDHKRDSEAKSKRATASQDGGEQVTLSEVDITAIAKQVAKSLKPKDHRAIATQIARSLRTRHFLLIGKSITRNPLFLALVIGGVIAGCATLWQLIPHVIKEKAQTIWNQQVTNEVKLQFQEPRISNIVVAVASAQTTNLMNQQIAPAITAFEIDLKDKLQAIQSNLNTIQTSAETNVTELRSIAAFYLLVVGAQAGNRDAFGKLSGIGADTNDAMHTLAQKLCVIVTARVTLDSMLIELAGTQAADEVWQGTTNTPETASFQYYTDRLYPGDLNLFAKIALMKQFSAQTRFPLERRLEVIAYYVKHHNDLTLVNAACGIMDEHAHLRKTFGSADDYVAWYENWAITNKAKAK